MQVRSADTIRLLRQGACRLFGGPLILVLLTAAAVSAFEPEKPECIAPAKPGGGHDIMCHLLADSLLESLLIDAPMTIRYMPGDIGARAYNHAVNLKTNSANTIIAASTGSALNLALGKFGRYTEADVRWLAAVGTDFGIIAVRSDSALLSLDDLLGTLREDVGALVFGAAGSVGSQDWMKAALTLDLGGVDPMAVRYIPYEGGGEATSALLKGHIQVFPGDLTEIARYIDSGEVRPLAVFAAERLDGPYRTIPTAREQGYDLVWPVWRGYYMPPGVSNDEFRWWLNTMHRLTKTEAFRRQRDGLKLFPLTLIGDEFDAYVKQTVGQMRSIARKFELTE